MDKDRLNSQKRIVIQGVRGSFHDIAARCYFPHDQLDLVVADSFEELFRLYENDKSIDHAIMAIENTIAGTILWNYQLLQNSSFHITGEVLLRIKQNLLVLPGTQLSDIQEVHSHPMALEQCKEFLNENKNWRRVAREDTALCAGEIALRQQRGVAAIASELAGKEYGLEVLAPEIETNKKNFTRFLILSRDKIHSTNGFKKQEKASICFSLKHETGSLGKILSTLAERSCNLTKIQSVPIVGKEWQYFFFADFILENNAFHQVINQLNEEVESLEVLGHYQKGEYHES